METQTGMPTFCPMLFPASDRKQWRCMSCYNWRTDIELKREVLLRPSNRAALHLLNGYIGLVENGDAGLLIFLSYHFLLEVGNGFNGFIGVLSWQVSKSYVISQESHFPTERQKEWLSRLDLFFQVFQFEEHVYFNLPSLIFLSNFCLPW